MNYQLTITLTEEQQSALEGIINDRNTRSGTDIKPEQHLTEIINAELIKYTAEAYSKSVSALSDAAKTLTFGQRSAIIEWVKQSVEAES